VVDAFHEPVAMADPDPELPEHYALEAVRIERTLAALRPAVGRVPEATIPSKSDHLRSTDGRSSGPEERVLVRRGERRRSGVGVSVGERTVGIRLFEKDILVFGSLGAGAGLVLEDEVPASCTVGGQTVVGGLLPQRATRAIAIDSSGDQYEGAVRAGMYVIKAGRDGLWQDLVRFEGEHGELVAQALTAGRRVPVPDAPEPCPLCADTAWVRITQDVYCSTCGLCVGEADSMAATSTKTRSPRRRATSHRIRPNSLRAFRFQSMSAMER
jgi:hypothetical protein